MEGNQRRVARHWSLVTLLNKAADQCGDFICSRVQCKMAGIENEDYRSVFTGPACILRNVNSSGTEMIRAVTLPRLSFTTRNVRSESGS